MKQSKAKMILIPTVALLIICLVASTLLALTNNMTAEKIADNAVQTEVKSRMVVLPEGKDFGDVTPYGDNGMTYCVGTDDSGKEVGYVFTANTKGYGGTISLMVGLDMNGTITGIEILSHSETPGLGANSTKPEFKERFISKSGTLEVNKNSNDGQYIQAITSATITSKAVTKAVNEVSDAFNEITGGVK